MVCFAFSHQICHQVEDIAGSDVASPAAASPAAASASVAGALSPAAAKESHELSRLHWQQLAGLRTYFGSEKKGV